MAFNRVTRGQALTGALNVGGGANVKKIATGSVAIDFGALPASGGTGSATFTVTGVAAGDVLVVNQAGSVGSSVCLSHVGISAADTGVAWAVNVGAASVNPASAAYTYLWIDLT